MPTVRVVLFAVCLIAPAYAASQRQPLPPLLAESAADFDVWRAALDEIRRDPPAHHSGSSGVRRSRVALRNQTIAAADIRSHLQETQLTNDLFQRLLDQNPVSVRFLDSERLRPFRILDLAQFRDHYGRFEWERLDRFASNERLWMVCVSRPGFSDDGMLAIVYTVTSGGFEDGHGYSFVFKKFDGSWVLSKRLLMWIS